MILLAMWDRPSFDYMLCTRFAFTKLGSSTQTVGLLQLRGKAQLLTMWNSWGSSWTLGSLRGALGFLTSRTFGNLESLGNLDLLGSLDLGPSWPL